MYYLRCFTGLLRFLKKYHKQYSTAKKESIKLDKVLLLNKLSRLEVEKHYQPTLSDEELEKNIKLRGIDYEALVKHHEINKTFREKVNSCFEQFGISVRKVNRFNLSQSDIDWCDAIIPIGGDGTFLHAARQIPNRNKPVIGFNSNPSTSEGFLCLPKKYSTDISLAITKLLKGEFKWMFRTRIRVSLRGQFNDQVIPTELHNVNSFTCKLSDIIGDEKSTSTTKSCKIKHKLPILALNEVFLTEIFAAKVSYFEMRINNSKTSVKVKSSGLCVCTGTGSTSWNLSINRLSKQDIHDILMLYIKQTNGKDENLEAIISNIYSSFNDRFRMDPEAQILRYTIRDLISLGVWPNPKGHIEQRGFANTIEVKSKCLDAGVIIDGGISFPFNEGSITFLETNSEDSLRTVVLHE